MLSGCHQKYIDDRVATGVYFWRKEDVASFTTLLGSAAGFPFHPLSVRAMTANAAEVQLAEILQRIEPAPAREATSAEQQTVG